MLGIFIFQDNGIPFVNQAVSDINGYSVEEMLTWTGRRLRARIHPDDSAFVTEQGRKKHNGDPSALATLQLPSRQQIWRNPLGGAIFAQRRLRRTLGCVRYPDRHYRAQAGRGLLGPACAQHGAHGQTGVARRAGRRHRPRLQQPAGRLVRTSGFGASTAGHGQRRRARIWTWRTRPTSEPEPSPASYWRSPRAGRRYASWARSRVSVKQCAEFALSGSNVKCELEL